MLYDPKWEKQTETKADPFSLESLIAWLETKDPNETYCVTHSGECLIAQWLKSIDPAAINSMRGDSFNYHVLGRDHDFRPGFARIAFGDPRTDGCRRLTFGAGLKRARAALAA